MKQNVEVCRFPQGLPNEYLLNLLAKNGFDTPKDGLGNQPTALPLNPDPGQTNIRGDAGSLLIEPALPARDRRGAVALLRRQEPVQLQGVLLGQERLAEDARQRAVRRA